LRVTDRVRLVTLTAVLVIGIPVSARAQEPSANLGLPAVAALGFHGGTAKLERSSDGHEGGVFLDVGWLRGRSLRLQAEVAFLRATLTEYIELEDSTYSGIYYALSAGATAVWIRPEAKLSPYLLAGVAVHALSSTFQTSVLDQRYNANRFGSHIGLGLRLRLGATRQALFGEARRIIADEVDRTVFRLGGIVLLNDLYRR
jgi:hypothetical protein